MPLTDKEIKGFKPLASDQWFSDARGLRLLVKSKTGSKYWRMKYRFEGKQKTLALGVYPEVSLKDARLERDRARLLIADGIDPLPSKHEIATSGASKDDLVFSVLAKQWWENQRLSWSDDHASRVLKRLEDNAFTLLDQKPSFLDVQPTDIMEVIRGIEERGALDVASRVLGAIRSVYKYGIQTGQVSVNPTADLSGVVKSRKVQHRASMPNEQLGGFLVDLDGYEAKGRLLTKLALELLVETFVRSGELRGAKWKEFELGDALWRIPAERMKMKSEHLVPLSTQALGVLKKLKAISGHCDLVFPSDKDNKVPMSDNTMRMAMFRLGFDGETKGKAKATPHGFRANASSILNEQGWNPDAIERQLSHQERNGVRASYTHHARYVDERTKMMQWWSDYLDTQKAKASKLDLLN